MIHSLQTRLTAMLMLLALLTILTISLLSTRFIENRFGDYVQKRISQEQERIIRSLSDMYQQKQHWDQQGLSLIGMEALGQGFILRIVDPQGLTIWDARTHNNGMCDDMLENMAATMAKRYPNWDGAYREAAFTLVDSLPGIKVWIGYYGPFYYNDADLDFLESLGQAIALTAIVSLVVASIIAWLIARWIARPLARLTSIAQNLRLGQFGQTQPFHSSIREVQSLAIAITTLAEALAQQQNLRLRHSQDVSHELRTPLSCLQASLEGMIDGIIPSNAQGLESCREEIIRLNRLVGKIEDLAILEAQDQSLQSIAINSSEIFITLCQQYQNEAKRQGIAFNFTIAPLAMNVDPDKIRQIFINLLSNALKFCDPGAQITVQLIPGPFATENLPKQWVCLQVRDTGIGIPAADLPYIFERLYRVDQSRSRARGGDGLGLAIAQSLVQQHGGKIEAASEVGKGSCFRVFLPCLII